MSNKPSSIRNLGPASDQFFGRAGIKTAEQIEKLGADEAYFQGLRAGGQPHFIGFYALVMGLQGRPWNDCKGKEKAALQIRFDAIKAKLGNSGKNLTGIEKELDDLGVIKNNRTP